MSDKRIQQMRCVHSEALELFSRKNKDYGDAFAQYGTIGVLVRLGDKIQRLLSIQKNGIQMVKQETLRDTLLDLHNYSAMAIFLMDEQEYKSILTDVYEQQKFDQSSKQWKHCGQVLCTDTMISVGDLFDPNFQTADSSWTVDYSMPNIDAEGWTYAYDFNNGSDGYPKCKWNTYVRRRKWKHIENKSSSTSEGSLQTEPIMHLTEEQSLNSCDSGKYDNIIV